MAKTRSYKLLCPIARALDRIGDRWTLLIIRDLHAGPARFSELQRGLTGIAANLLTERLTKLVADGLVEHFDGPHGVGLYRLTDLGRRTQDILFDLALFGGRFPSQGELVQPGNLRTVATTLGAAAQRAKTDHMKFEASFIVDGENMCLSVNSGQSSMVYEVCETPDLIFETKYTALLAMSEGELDFSTFVSEHSRLTVLTAGKDIEFQDLMMKIVDVFS